MQKTKKPNYKWLVVAASFLMVMVTLGFCSSPKSFYLSAITEALGFSRGAFSVSDSCRFITTAIVNIFFGVLLTKFGVRKMVAAGFGFLVAFALISAFATNIFAFYLAGVFLGLGLSWTTTTMVGYVVNLWCKEHKGTIMGLVLAANGIGGAIATQILAPFIQSPENKFGYRTSYVITAAVLAVAGCIVVGLYRNSPQNQPEAETKKQPDEKCENREKNGTFYAVAACVFFTGLILQGQYGMSVAHMKDIGLDSSYITAIMSVNSLLLAGSKFLCGIVHDRIGLKKTVLICQISALVATLLLLAIVPTSAGKAMAVVYCVASAVALPLETVMLPLIALDVWGEGNYTKYLGILVSINTAGYALGGPFTNSFYDLFGNYRLALITMGILMLTITALLQYVLNRSECRTSSVVNEY